MTSGLTSGGSVQAMLGNARSGVVSTETVRLFVPIISANTEHAEEGYVFKEWDEAADRAREIPSRRFIVPVVIDDDYDGDPRSTARYQMHSGACSSVVPPVVIPTLSSRRC